MQIGYWVAVTLKSLQQRAASSKKRLLFVSDRIAAFCRFCTFGWFDTWDRCMSKWVVCKLRRGRGWATSKQGYFNVMWWLHRQPACSVASPLLFSNLITKSVANEHMIRERPRWPKGSGVDTHWKQKSKLKIWGVACLKFVPSKWKSKNAYIF